MNDYRISSSAGDVTITAVDEKDARRIFRQTHTKEANNAYAIALIRENVPATKAQEREALEKIKAIIAPLGPRSYVGTALEGCLEDAEVNIENDFGDSMKARWQDAERRVAEAEKETAELKEKLHREIEEKQQARGEAQAAIKKLESRTLSPGTLTVIAQVVDDYISRLRDKVKAAEGTILEYAEHPETTTFVDAVKERKSLSNDIGYYQALAQTIIHAQGQ